MSSIFSVLTQVFVALCVVAPVLAYPDRLACDKVLMVGNIYMRSIAAIGGVNSKLRIENSAGTVLTDGASYTPGMMYTAILTLDDGEQFATDFSTAITSTTTSNEAKCDSKRVWQRSGGAQSITFTVPTNFTGNYAISLGYTTSSRVPVEIVTSTLVAPSAETPTLAPVDGLGLGSCAQCTKNVYNADCGAFSTEKNECDSTLSDANCCASSSGDCCEPNAGMIAGVTVGAFVFVVLCCVGVYYASTMDGKNTGEYGQAQNQEEEIGMQATSGQNGDQKLAVTGEVADNI